MKTKVLLIALTTTVFALGAKAQKTTFGVRGGINFVNINGKNVAGNELDNKIKAGFNLGVNAEIPVAPDFYVQPGVLFTTKGAKDKYYRKANYRLSYIEIPINLLFKPELGDGKLLLGFGPYVAFAVGGTRTDDQGHKDDYVFQAKATQAEALTNLYLKRMDFGGNLLAGYELSSKLSFQLNAQLGMSNFRSKVEGGEKAKFKNTSFGVSVGYRF